VSRAPDYAYVHAFARELARSGVRHVCFAPGSRSTPLVMAMAEQEGLTLWRHLDERSAAYFALGMAKASGTPVGIVCTSGSAAANLYPAVMEAYYGRVPLVVMTADRPPEAQGIGSPQTVDQVKIFGSHVKWFANMPPEADAPEAAAYVEAAACRAVLEAVECPQGPVHLNFPFREPLIPGPAPKAAHGPARVAAAPRRSCTDPELFGALARELGAVERGLIVCGPQDRPGLGEAVAALAAALGWPVLADPLSQVRAGRHDTSLVACGYDALLRSEEFAARHKPEAVLRFGAAPTSKALNTFLARAGGRQILVDPAGWNDPLLSATQIVRADPFDFCASLAEAVRRNSAPPAGTYARSWLAHSRAARAAIREAIEAGDAPAEGRLFAELAELLPEGAVLFAGNSMPVRDLDGFFPSVPKRLRFMANRGTNGIDGVTSTALGAAAVLEGPLVLVVGDISFLHDIGGLYAARQHRLDATVILIHNDGGGIFSFLPQAEHPERFEELFGTPHGLDFRGAVETFGGRFERVRDWSHFRELMRASLEGGLHVIELRTDRRENVEQHRRVWERVRRAVSRLSSE